MHDYLCVLARWAAMLACALLSVWQSVSHGHQCVLHVASPSLVVCEGLQIESRLQTPETKLDVAPVRF